MNRLQVSLLHPRATVPSRAHSGDLGLDLCCVDPVTLNPGEQVLIKTGVACQFPAGYGALIRDRSSVATKKKLAVVAGVIDNGYTGEIGVAMWNLGNTIQHFAPGDKIAQMILVPVVPVETSIVSEVESLDGRGDNGYGSTGK